VPDVAGRQDATRQSVLPPKLTAFALTLGTGANSVTRPSLAAVNLVTVLAESVTVLRRCTRERKRRFTRHVRGHAVNREENRPPLPAWAVR
jgi:hypothetical protein